MSFLQKLFGRNDKSSVQRADDAVPSAPVFPSTDDEIDSYLRDGARDTIWFHCPNPPDIPCGSLSFFGGLPFLPAGLNWPKSLSVPGSQTFIAQVDCSTLPDCEGRDSLPRNGFLYFFRQSVLYAECSSADLVEAVEPADLGYTETESPRIVYPWLEEEEGFPTLYPKWPMSPVCAKSYPSVHPTEDGGEIASLLNNVQHELNKTAQNNEFGRWTADPFPLRNDARLGTSGVRFPTQTFPEVWIFVRIISGAVRRKCIDALREADWRKDIQAETLIAARDIRDQSEDWIRRAEAASHFTKVDPAERIRFRDWLIELAGRASRTGPVQLEDWKINEEIWEATNVGTDYCLAYSAESAGLISDELLNLTDFRSWGRKFRLIGNPSNCQNSVYNHRDCLLLMEYDEEVLSPAKWTEGLIQYWIKPEDLQAGRFENAVASAEYA